eukprot:1497700-Rhodomonas_salina.3
MSGTGIVYAAICVRARYAMPRTETRGTAKSITGKRTSGTSCMEIAAALRRGGERSEGEGARERERRKKEREKERERGTERLRSSESE